MPILVNNMNILGLIESSKNDSNNSIKTGNGNNTGTQFIEIPQLSEELIRSAVNGISSKNNNNSSNQSNNNNNNNNAANTTSSSMDDDPDSPLYGPDGKAKKAHSCPFCDRSFTRPYRLNDHISFSHTDERKYTCLMCSKNFSCKDKLKHHIDVKHDNKKPIITHPKTRTKYRNTEDLRCEYPNCTKVFANKYNVKRHIENVHMKMRRRRHKSGRSGNSHNNTANTSSSTLNSSLNTTVNTTGNNSVSAASSAAATAAATLQLGIGNLATSLTSMGNLNLAGGHLTIAPKGYNGNNNQTTLLPTSSIIALPLSQTSNGSPLLGKPELSSTPVSKKGRSSQNNNQHQQQQQQQQHFQVANLNNSIQLTSATPITTANGNLVNLSLNPAQTATLLTNGLGGGNNGQGGQNAPLTLVATSNGIGGITLTTLGSLHQQHHSQQAQFQQFQSQQPQQHQIVTNLANLGGSTGTILTLNGQPILIQQPSNNTSHQQQITTNNGHQHIIYQQQPTAILQPLGGSQSGSNKSGNLVIQNNGIIGLAPSGTATTAADLLGNHILLQANNSNSIQLSQNSGNSSSNNSGNLNAVTMAELVNSLIVKSENSSNVNNLLGSDGLLNFAELTATSSDNIGNEQQHTLHTVDFSNPSNNNNNNNNTNGDHEQHNNDHLEEEKDNKIYTCARCPEIFNSSILLRKHVSENHEKEYECCICNMSFGNRFTFLKHKYSHINYETNRLIAARHNSATTNRPTDLIDFEEEESAESEQLHITTSKKTNQTKDSPGGENLFDLNSIYKRSLMNSENLMQCKPELFENCRNVIQQGSVKLGPNQSSLANVYRKTNCCDICFKCFSEKKKLVAHRKICQAKMDTSGKASQAPTGLVKSKSQVDSTIPPGSKRIRSVKSMNMQTSTSFSSGQAQSSSSTVEINNPQANTNNSSNGEQHSGANNPASSLSAADLPLNLDFLFE